MIAVSRQLKVICYLLTRLNTDKEKSLLNQMIITTCHAHHLGLKKTIITENCVKIFDCPGGILNRFFFRGLSLG